MLRSKKKKNKLTLYFKKNKNYQNYSNKMNKINLNWNWKKHNKYK